ncbi:MAG: inositol monophosphatase [Deltaproteobacteria bacterium HGW-Deltaproteobacteria-12]|jgi:myo-inositol-1(or 4)-monophosphatase|nr:MAG: inositol monophosphatase [Deltaproteobacteria bacterium HGW-Deltaproteobacteria-12]
MNEMKDFTVKLAQEAGALLMEKFDQSIAVSYKGDINLVTEADKMSESLIIAAIRQNFPDSGILAEESPAIPGTRLRWIIDPLDGTTNYAHGYPVFCVSIALEKDGLVELGVIYDPTRRDTFTAVRGRGAYLNGKRLAVSTTFDLNRSLLATGFPYDIRESKENNINYFNGMAKEVQAIRRAGAAALDMAYVAAGRFDGFWELKLQPWDVAAARLMIEEAGGEITEISGSSWNMLSPNILASNGRIHQQMIAVLRRAAAR